MQKLFNFEDTCFTRNIHKYRFKKKICFKIHRIIVLENVICTIKHFANFKKPSSNLGPFLKDTFTVQF